MKKTLCLLLTALTMTLTAAAEAPLTYATPAPQATPAPAPENPWGLVSGVYEIVRNDPRFAGYEVVSDSGRSSYSYQGQFWNHAILQNGEEILFISARTEEDGWVADMISVAPVYQPGSEDATRLGAPRIYSDTFGLTLNYNDVERYTFYFDPDLGEYVLYEARFNQDQLFGDSYIQDKTGLLFWQGGPADTFLPIGEAMLLTDGITLAEFNIEQLPRSLAEVRAVNQVKDALDQPEDQASAGVPLCAVADTFLTDDPFGTQAAQMQIPAGTALAGLSAAGEFYAHVVTADGTRGYVPMKALNPVYDLAFDPEQPNAAVRWDVMTALIGKWRNLPDGTRLILCADGSWRQAKSGAGLGNNCLNFGNYRIYDGEDGAYRIIFRTEANEEWACSLTLGADGSITLSEGEDALTLTRPEYSTFGNG